jgi:hypothetical protein
MNILSNTNNVSDINNINFTNIIEYIHNYYHKLGTSQNIIKYLTDYS